LIELRAASTCPTCQSANQRGNVLDSFVFKHRCLFYEKHCSAQCFMKTILFFVSVTSGPPEVVLTSGPPEVDHSRFERTQGKTWCVYLVGMQLDRTRAVLNLRTTTSQKCEAVPRRARI